MQHDSPPHQVICAPTTATITLQGSLRLHGTAEYDRLAQPMLELAATQPEHITLDLQNLDFLNSSGINMLFGFIIRVRDLGRSTILVRGSRRIPWQTKSLPNLPRLMPELQLEWS